MKTFENEIVGLMQTWKSVYENYFVFLLQNQSLTD